LPAALVNVAEPYHPKSDNLTQPPIMDFCAEVEILWRECAYLATLQDKDRHSHDDTLNHTTTQRAEMAHKPPSPSTPAGNVRDFNSLLLDDLDAICVQLF